MQVMVEILYFLHLLPIGGGRGGGNGILQVILRVWRVLMVDLAVEQVVLMH